MRTAFLRQVRFGRDGAESTTRSYAGSIALFLRWCDRPGRTVAGGGGAARIVHDMAGGTRCLRLRGPEPASRGAVLAGPGASRARSARRVNGVLTAVRRMVVHAVAAGQAQRAIWCRCCMRWLTTGTCRRQARDGGRADELAAAGPAPAAGSRRPGWTGHRMRRSSRCLRACRSARDRLIVLLMARAGLRCGEVCGLRRSDVHLLAGLAPLGCEVARAHLHVIRREDNPNGAWAKSRRQRVVPLDFLDGAGVRHLRVRADGRSPGAGSDFVLVNLFREPVGAPMRPGRGRRAGHCGAAGGPGWSGLSQPHQLRHACGSNLLDAGGALDEAQDILGHACARLDAGVSAPGPGPAAGCGGPGAQPSRAGRGDIVTGAELALAAPALPIPAQSSATCWTASP